MISDCVDSFTGFYSTRFSFVISFVILMMVITFLVKLSFSNISCIFVVITFALSIYWFFFILHFSKIYYSSWFFHIISFTFSCESYFLGLDFIVKSYGFFFLIITLDHTSSSIHFLDLAGMPRWLWDRLEEFLFFLWFFSSLFLIHDNFLFMTVFYLFRLSHVLFIFFIKTSTC